MNYYNENNPYCAQWLVNLVAAGCIPYGYVDSRSIVDVHPSDLAGFTQCHFFAGIGGWCLAAAIAGWPSTRQLWTGSPPCQPFSNAGLGAGMDDPRHLWPYLLRLVLACRPPRWMGEQVKDAIGKHWLDRVFDDLEANDYTGRPVVIPACAANAPHGRERIFIVADANEQRTQVSAQGDIAAVKMLGSDFYSDWTPIACNDGKVRRIEPSTPLLADGVPYQVDIVRAFGNAIVPQVAAEVIAAYMECQP